MILGIGAILLLVILVYSVIAFKLQVNHLQNLARREAELIAALAERAISRAMVEGRSDEVQALLEKIGAEPDLLRIRIVDPQGVILRSDRAEEVGNVLPRTERLFANTTPGAIWDYQARTVGIFRPILNGPSCYACHPQDQPVIAFLNASVSFSGMTREVVRSFPLFMLPGILALVAAGALISFLFALGIGRRIDRLARTMGQVESGDLAARVPEDSPDEVGRLGRGFNAMVAQLAETQRRLKDRHAEEIRRAEHLAALGKMAAGVAHEINNPLAGMQNCVRTLLKKAGDDTQGIQYLSMVQEGLGRIGRTVRELLDFAHEAKPKMAQAELTPLLRRCLTLLEHELKARRISAAFSADPRIPALRGDFQQLEQLFLNILLNGVEAMPNGGSLTVTAGLQQRHSGAFTEVRITDTGIGISSDHLPRIFDPFFTTKEMGKGTGLGLSVSYGIVKTHGGSIEVQSEVGKGSTVTVMLPVREGEGI